MIINNQYEKQMKLKKNMVSDDYIPLEKQT
jgi:hypothetical protein